MHGQEGSIRMIMFFHYTCIVCQVYCEGSELDNYASIVYFLFVAEQANKTPFSMYNSST